MNQRIHHFYHVFADGNWQSIVEDHLHALKTYGLYDSLTSFNVGFVGSEQNIAAVESFLEENDVVYNVADKKESGWEQVTIHPLWEMAHMDETCYLSYAHTKGAAHDYSIVPNWRGGMTRATIVEWKRCVEALDRGYSTVGCHLQPGRSDQPFPFWGGNFWWATSLHIRSLGKCVENTRYDAEAWIGACHLTDVFKPYDVLPISIGSNYEPY